MFNLEVFLTKDIDGNDSFETAADVSSNLNGAPIHGNVGVGDAKDFYAFTPTTTGQYRFDLSDVIDDLDLRLWESDGGTIGESLYWGNSNETISYSLVAGQTYYIEVYPWGIGSDYTLSISNAVSVTSVTDTAGVVSLGAPLYAIDGGAGAQVIFGPSGVPVVEGSLGDWDLIAAKWNGTGYSLLWQSAGGDFAIWDLTSSGGFISGSVVDLEDAEEVFILNLDGNNFIGYQPEQIEANGSFALLLDNEGYIVESEQSAPVRIVVDDGGALFDLTGGGTLLQAEVTGTGYRLLGITASGQYAEVETGIDGNVLLDSFAFVDDLVGTEEFYDADLNGDGEIGHTITLIESSGSHSVYGSTVGTYSIVSQNSSVTVTQNGANIGPNTLQGWQMVQAEDDFSGGYTVLWKEGSSTYAVWQLNGDGEFLSGELIDNAVDYEVFFTADLNGDNEIGHITAAIETLGVDLYYSTQGAYLIDDDRIPVTQNGVVIGPNTLQGWQMVQAQTNYSMDGYFVLWEEDSGAYAIWELDSTVEFLSGELIDNVVDYEALFGADVNGDGTVGHILTAIEEKGLSLFSSSNGSYYINSDDIEVTRNGAAIGPDTLPGWQMVQAEFSTSANGFTVLWQADSGAFATWELDPAGRFVSGELIDNVLDYEMFFDADLNGDTLIGHVPTPIETNGQAGLYSSTDGAYYLNYGFAIAVTQNGTPVGPNTLQGWQMVQAEIDVASATFSVLWKSDSGAYAVWQLDDSGEFQSGELVANVVDYEQQFFADVNGDGEIGHADFTLDLFGEVIAVLTTREGYAIAFGDTLAFVTQGGERVREDTLPGWDMLQAERNATDTGYIVLWQEDSGAYAVWDLDESGAFTGGALADNVDELEDLFSLPEGYLPDDFVL